MCMTNVVVVHAQIISSQCMFSTVSVQDIIAPNESSTTLVFLAGGYKEPGQDCTAGCCSPRPHGGGEGPAAGQQLHRGQGWRWRHSIALHRIRVSTHTDFLHKGAKVTRTHTNTVLEFAKGCSSALCGFRKPGDWRMYSKALACLFPCNMIIHSQKWQH